MSKPLLVVLSLFGLVAVALAGCGANQYGADCSCSSDVDTLIAARNLGATFSAACAGGKWTISGAGLFDIGNAVWNINTDTIEFTSAAFSSNAATISFSLNMVAPTKSGFLRIPGTAILNGITKFVLNDWVRANRTAMTVFNFTMPYMRIGAPSGQFQPTAPTLLAADQTCWEIPPGAQATFGQSSSGGLTTFTATAPMRLKSGSGCGGGSDRGWVVAFIVILVLWGAGLGLFALITCKIDSCYSMWWALK